MLAPDTGDEAVLMDAVQRAVDLSDTMHPTDAVAKTAEELALTPGRIRSVCTAVNAGRQVLQQETGGRTTDKLASFPLADPDAVVARLFGKPAAKEAAHADYELAPTRVLLRPEPVATVKAASAVAAPPRRSDDPADVLARRFDERDALRRKAAQLRGEAYDLETALHADLCKVADWMRLEPYSRRRLNEVGAGIRRLHGELGVAFAKTAHAQARCFEPLDFRPVPLASPLRADETPLLEIGRAVKTARALVRARALQTVAEKAAEEAHAALFPQPPVPVAPDLLDADFAEKVAAGPAGAIMTGIGFGTGNMLTKALGQPRGDLVEGMVDTLDSPDHLDELRKIRAHAMLTGMLTDPDDPISGYDPDQVLDAYNEIAQMSPHIAEQPAALRPVLRRRLEGHTQTFEAKEQAELERALTPQPPRDAQKEPQA